MSSLDVSSTSINDLPIEVLERIADFVAWSGPLITSKTDIYGGPSFVNPFTGKPWSTDPATSSARLNLLNFSQVCRTFRVASFRHLPDLVRDITIDSFSELERIRDDAKTRERLRPVHHITLSFEIPLTVTRQRLKEALVVLCCHPSWPYPVFSNLEGVSFSSKFMSSYSAYENVQRDWQAVARDQLGLTGFSAQLFGGFAKFSSMLAGGHSVTERLGDAECLFLKWDKGQKWTPQHDLIFRNHVPPPITPISYNNASMKWLITIFPPSFLKKPPLLSHPAIHASHFLLSSVLSTPKSSTSTPLRPFSAHQERIENAHLLAEFDLARQEFLQGPAAASLFDREGTVMYAIMLLDQLVFSIPEPSVIDSLERQFLQLDL